MHFIHTHPTHPHPPKNKPKALSWVVNEALTPLNFVLAVEATVWFVERAAAEHTDLQVGRKGWRSGRPVGRLNRRERERLHCCPVTRETNNSEKPPEPHRISSNPNRIQPPN